MLDYLLGYYTLDGLDRFTPVNGNGKFSLSPNFTKLNFYFGCDLKSDGHLSLSKPYTLYSNYLLNNFNFFESNTTNQGYLNTIATAISEFAMRNVWAVYHQSNIFEYLNCVLEV